MKTKRVGLLWGLVLGGLIVGCQQAKEKAAEVTNSLNVKGHWLMTESQNANALEKAAEKESVVATFADGKMAFSPTDSEKAKIVYGLISHCIVGPRPYHTEKYDIVFDAVTDCPEKRVTVTQLDGTHLKFPDPDKPQIVRTFVKIDDAHFEALVKPADRKL